MKYRLTLMIVAALGFCHSAAAELVHFEFSGTVSGTLDVGGGAMAFNANPFTVVGDVTSTTDLSGDPNRGIFAATGTYNIAGIGTFVSDPGGDYYSQYGAAAGTIDRHEPHCRGSERTSGDRTESGADESVQRRAAALPVEFIRTFAHIHGDERHRVRNHRAGTGPGRAMAVRCGNELARFAAPAAARPCDTRPFPNAALQETLR